MAQAILVKYQQWLCLYFCIIVWDCFDPQWGSVHIPLWRSVGYRATPHDITTMNTLFIKLFPSLE